MKERVRRKAQRPSEIIEAAFDAFAERGFSATRMEDVAARVGVAKGTIYLYFESKERLFEAMVDHYSQGILADAEEILAVSHGNSAEKLKAFVQYIYDRCVQDFHGREIVRFLVSDGKAFPALVERYRRTFFVPAMDIVSKLLVTGTAEGEFVLDASKYGPQIVVAPAALLSLLQLIFQECLRIDSDADVSAHIELLFRGLWTPTTRNCLDSVSASNKFTNEN